MPANSRWDLIRALRVNKGNIRDRLKESGIKISDILGTSRECIEMFFLQSNCVKRDSWLHGKKMRPLVILRFLNHGFNLSVSLVYLIMLD